MQTGTPSPPPQGSKVKKGSAGPPRPSTPAVAVPRVTAASSARAAVAALTVAPTPKATAVVGARKTLARRTVPSSPPARLSAVAAPGHKRGREAPSFEATTLYLRNIEAALAQSAGAETAAPERPRKRALLVFSEGEDGEEVPPDVVVVEEEATAEVPYVKEASTAEEVVEEAATAEEVVEMLDAETASAEVPAAEEAAYEAAEEAAVEAAEEATTDVPDDEVIIVEPTRTALVEVLSAVSVGPSLATTVPVEPSPSPPSRPSGIVFRLPPQSSPPLSTVAAIMPPVPLSRDSTVVTELEVTGAMVVGVPSLMRAA
ncbi:uncharacterized protein Pyn_37276 [Prunus yedoensis var. nudiflora]|uniref:Uncharacterized protein n=1 Tax=Prunus yedoensis var. nudiflora TaxID=2094558 RepID=A0A314XQ33_PRUYE|nr:uncharacterized protein Pyn_37276 [Prunus yedoensis var. nudiflora]